MIVQDIGLATELVKQFPDLPIHASTQMTISNLDGVRLMEKLGLKRVVLARELSLKEIRHIRKNTGMELEVFGHGALCISYSGQCLFSSMVGKRSGNRGLCAGPCRLDYKLLKNGNTIENGYLLSPKDICTLQILPELIECGIDSLKIEGRKKSYEYVAIVTKIYRKYIDLAQDKTKEYKVEEEDLKQILQIYNRGGMGTGYFENRKNIVYPEKPNHLGIYIGNIKAINLKKKQITLDRKNEVSMGDVIRVGNDSSYISQIINGETIGEIKDVKKMKIKDKVYKIVSNTLNKKQWENHKKEIKKVDISCNLYQDGENICLELYNDSIRVKSALKYENHNIKELDKTRILCQIQKTGNTIFHIKNVNIEVENLKLSVSELNRLRRETTQKFEMALENSIRREYKGEFKAKFEVLNAQLQEKPKINLFLQKFNRDMDYSKFDYYEIYVPFADLINCPQMRDCIAVLPNIVDENYEKFILENQQVFEKVKAIMISHISQIELLEKLKINKKVVADYTLNITNNLSQKVLKDLQIQRFTISPELDKNAVNYLADEIEKELVVYGRTCLMTSKYCPIGKNEDCKKACKQGNYELKDRKNFVFPIVSDCVNCHTKIYNSKILSTDSQKVRVDFVRMDVLNETETEIQKIISVIKAGKRLTGEDYTNGNLT